MPPAQPASGVLADTLNHSSHCERTAIMAFTLPQAPPLNAPLRIDVQPGDLYKNQTTRQGIPDGSSDTTMQNRYRDVQPTCPPVDGQAVSERSACRREPL
jgi:hypothetical protein